MRPDTMPRPERLAAYVAAVALLGWPVSFWRAVTAGTVPGWQAGVLAVTVLLSVWVPLRLQRGGDSHGVTIEEAVLVALLAMGAGPWAGVLLGGAVTLGHALLRSRPAKIVFNSSQVALSAAAAALVFEALGSPSTVLSSGWLFAVAASVAVYALIGLTATTGLFVLLQGRTRGELFGEAWRLVATTTAGNLMFGIVLAFLAVTDDRMLVMGVVLAILVQLGYRGYARIVHDRTRTELLQETTRALVEVAGDPTRFGEVLVRLSSLLGGRRAELALVSPQGVRCLAATADGHIEERALEPASAVAESLRTGGNVLRAGSDDGTVSAIAVPVISEGSVLGAIAVVERHGLEPWSEIDLGLLASLAHEASAALRTVELFDEVVRERSRYADESRKLSDVVNATSDGIVTLDVGGNVTVWNEALSAITGIAADEASGRPWFTVLRLRDDEGRDLTDRQSNPVTAVLAEGVAAAGVDLQVMRRDGSWRWLRCTINPVVSAEDGTTGAVVVGRDITAQREIEELKADFMATVSHELRTPLTPLLGFVETLDSRGAEMTDEHRSRAYGAMRTQLHRLNKLVDDLLLAAQSDAGPGALERAHVDLFAITAQVAGGLDPADRERVQVLPGDGVLAVGDPRGVERVVAELIDNALKHTDGRVRVQFGGAGTSTTLAVVDEGPGIPVADQARVFERFGRLGDHLHRTQGPGLGLSIARALAEQMEGALEIASAPGEGSTFTLRLAAVARTAKARPNLRAVSGE